MAVKIKICGITTQEAVEAARNADYLGFIFFAGSPRGVTTRKAAMLASLSSVPTVAVTVDADNGLLDSIIRTLKPAWLQLHGNESPVRVREIKDKYKLPVIKAISVGSEEDVLKAKDYESAADMLMFDTKASGPVPGGTGTVFDWKLLAGKQFAKPWFLSGGLSLDNVEEAVRTSIAERVDISSGVESAPGIKDPAKVKAFIEKVRNLQP